MANGLNLEPIKLALAAAPYLILTPLDGEGLDYVGDVAGQHDALACQRRLFDDYDYSQVITSRPLAGTW